MAWTIKRQNPDLIYQQMVGMAEKLRAKRAG